MLDLASGQTSVRSNWPLIILVYAGNCLWSDRARPKWLLIRQVSDHCPDKSALEAFSRPCNSSAPRTCVRSKMVWSELNSVWPPRPGLASSSVDTYNPENWVFFSIWKWTHERSNEHTKKRKKIMNSCVQTFMRLSDFRAFTRFSCVHVHVCAFFDVSRPCNFERTTPPPPPPPPLVPSSPPPSCVHLRSGHTCFRLGPQPGHRFLVGKKFPSALMMHDFHSSRLRLSPAQRSFFKWSVIILLFVG